MMLKVRIAAWLLKSASLDFEYRVKRQKIHVGPDDDKPKPQHADGTTVQRGPKLRDALQKFRAMRVADNDVVSIQIVARIVERKADVQRT